MLKLEMYSRLLLSKRSLYFLYRKGDVGMKQKVMFLRVFDPSKEVTYYEP